MRGCVLMRVSLFFLTDVKYGGFVSYTEHLVRALRARGHAAFVYKIRKTTEAKLRPFSGGVPYQNLSLADALRKLMGGPGLIVCLNWKAYGKAALHLLRAHVDLVLHDPTEFDGALLDEARRLGTRVVSIRQPNHEALLKLGIASRFVPHPYVPAPPSSSLVPWSSRPVHAVTLSRVDFDKHTDIVAKANVLLPLDKRVLIYGPQNRLYVFHKLDKECPGWEANYRGPFPLAPFAAVRLAETSRFVVDMSAIKGDGGGTQYTFFEAWDAGAALVLSTKWLKAGFNVLEHGRHALFVEDAAALAGVLASADSRADVVEGGRSLMKQHAADVVGPQYEDFFAK